MYFGWGIQLFTPPSDSTPLLLYFSVGICKTTSDFFFALGLNRSWVSKCRAGWGWGKQMGNYFYFTFTIWRFTDGMGFGWMEWASPSSPPPRAWRERGKMGGEGKDKKSTTNSLYQRNELSFSCAGRQPKCFFMLPSSSCLAFPCSFFILTFYKSPCSKWGWF